MNVHESLKTKNIDEMTDFLYTLSATDLSKCQILCNGQFCYQPPEKRDCRQKYKEYLQSKANEQDEPITAFKYGTPCIGKVTAE